MDAWQTASLKRLRHVDFVLTDVDDTLTCNGQLHGATLDALERLRQAGIKTIPVTAASAGWGQMMASMWPVEAVIAENGGLSFSRVQGVWRRQYYDADKRTGLAALDTVLRARFPELQPSEDAPYRETCLAYSRFGNADANERFLRHLDSIGMRGTVNSLWLLAWTGAWDKLAMSQILLQRDYAVLWSDAAVRVFYVGDSQNDEVMFAALPLSAGVATILKHQLRHWPAWITTGAGGAGFVEIADRLLAARGSR